MNRFIAQPRQNSGLEPVLDHGALNVRKRPHAFYPDACMLDTFVLAQRNRLTAAEEGYADQHGARSGEGGTTAEPCHAWTRLRIDYIAPRCFWLLCLLLALTGCQAGTEEEAEHHRPEHKPHDFLAAIERLQQLEMELADAQSRAAGQLDVWQETYDLSRWLPELAAESDLPESAWNELDDAARQLEQGLVILMKTDRSQRSAVFRERQNEFALQLQRLDQIRQQFTMLAVGAADNEVPDRPSPSKHRSDN